MIVDRASGIKYIKLGDDLPNTYELSEDWLEYVAIFHKPCGHGLIQLDPTGNLLIRNGFRWDGATMCPDWLTGIKGPLVHDALYGLIQQGLLSKNYRDEVDGLLVDIIKSECRVDRVFPRRWLRRASTGLIWACVRMFGWRHVKSMTEKADDSVDPMASPERQYQDMVRTDDTWQRWANTLNDTDDAITARKLLTDKAWREATLRRGQHDTR